MLRFPGRVASLPLAALGQATRRTLLAAEQGFLVQRVQLLFGSVRMPIMVGPASLGDRTGLGLGVGMAPPLGPVRLTAMFDASTGLYTRARARLAAGPASVEYRRDRRPSDRYFGPGIDSGVDAESRYGLLQDAVVAGIDLHSAVRGDRVPGASFSLWAGPRWSRITRGYHADAASIADEFPGVVANTLDRDFEHLAYGARLAADHRGGEPHWTHGWRASFGAERFDRPFAASPSRTGAQFTRYSLLAEGGLSFWRDPRTLRVTFTATDNELGAGSERFLVSDLARLGGSSGLAGYEPQRFHDLDVMNVRAAYIFPLADHFEMDLHADAGGAFLDMQEARPNLLRQSAGFALRGRAKTALVASIGLDVGPEAARFVFSLGAEP
ncbi:MAG: hypothetical protein ABIS67_03855 [Candidatus Eisenbacteria bacterium]